MWDGARLPVPKGRQKLAGGEARNERNPRMRASKTDCARKEAREDRSCHRPTSRCISILHQEEHHRVTTFQEEYVAMLKLSAWH